MLCSPRCADSLQPLPLFPKPAAHKPHRTLPSRGRITASIRRKPAMNTVNPLLIERHGPVEWLTLNRPERSNALNAALVDALLDYFTQLREREEVRVVVLRAAGRNFCAGLDLTEPEFNPQPRSPQGIWKVQRRIAAIYQAMRACPQPIVALIQGAACGGGFSLA
ncbi:MAG TPA: hypothetical protein DEQ90_00285, partial [Halieaceae bacterium]|nr:hypothetical protein [Halieaceae bacterium]